MYRHPNFVTGFVFPTSNVWRVFVSSIPKCWRVLFFNREVWRVLVVLADPKHLQKNDKNMDLTKLSHPPKTPHLRPRIPLSNRVSKCWMLLTSIVLWILGRNQDQRQTMSISSWCSSRLSWCVFWQQTGQKKQIKQLTAGNFIVIYYIFHWANSWQCGKMR